MDSRTPLGQIESEPVAAFWRRFLADTGRDLAITQPEAWAFGDSVEVANELLALVLSGRKRATASSVAAYQADGESLPQVGDLQIVVDGSGHPRVVIASSDIRIGPLSSVDDEFAYDEGEGDRSRNYWVEVHTSCFQRSLPAIGVDFTPDMQTVFERFIVVYQEA